MPFPRHGPCRSGRRSTGAHHTGAAEPPRRAAASAAHRTSVVAYRTVGVTSIETIAFRSGTGLRCVRNRFGPIVGGTHDDDRRGDRAERHLAHQSRSGTGALRSCSRRTAARGRCERHRSRHRCPNAVPAPPCVPSPGERRLAVRWSWRVRYSTRPHRPSPRGPGSRPPRDVDRTATGDPAAGAGPRRARRPDGGRSPGHPLIVRIVRRLIGRAVLARGSSAEPTPTPLAPTPPATTPPATTRCMDTVVLPVLTHI